MGKDTIAEKKLKGLIKKLSGIRGRHTELITIYVPVGSNLNMVSNQVTQEQGTAANIKSKAVRKNVLGALEKISQHLKFYKQTPPNGLAIFSGNVSEKEGESDIELWALEPPEKLNQRLYRCDQEFVLDPLKYLVREKEVYGLIVLDKSESEIGTLKGKRVESLKHLESLVPGKTKKGGWCVHEDSLMQMSDGRIEKVKNIKEDEFLGYNFKKMEVVKARHNHYFTRTSKDALKFTTIAPTSEIVVTPEHKFFIANKTGFATKHASDITLDDSLLFTKRLDIKGVEQKIKFNSPVQYIISKKGLVYLNKKRNELGFGQNKVAELIGLSQTTISKLEKGDRNLKKHNLRKVLSVYNIDNIDFFDKFVIAKANLEFPRIVNEDFAQLLGYLTGDGNRDKNRIIISEGELGVLKSYSKIIKNLFSIEAKIRKRSNKGYYELRIYKKSLLSLIENGFPGVLTPHKKEIPDKIPMLKKTELAGFIRGLYDAEGWIDKKARVLGITMNSKDVISKLHMMLLRWGIVTSVRTVGNRGSYAKKDRYNIRITDKLSLKAFSKFISFTSPVKRKALEKITLKSDTSYVDQIPIKGSQLLGIIHDLGMTTDDFPKVQDFFSDKKGMSYGVFRKNIIEIIENRKFDDTKKPILDFLSSIINSNLISVRVKSIKSAKTNDIFYDMEIPEHRSFIANGFILHNVPANYAI